MKTALTLAALVSSAAAYDGTLGVGGNPSELTREEWGSNFKNPNATGTYTFTGYNVSESFPPDDTVDGWQATIQVANVTNDPDADFPYPGIDISIDAPDGMKLPELNSSRTNESNWHVCIAFWTPKVLDDDAIDDGQDDDGDCSSFMSEECIETLKAQGNGYFWDGDSCGLNLPSVPDACEKYFRDDGIQTSGLGLGANLSRFDGDTIISERPQMVGDEDHAMSEEEAYEYAVRGVWTVMIYWGRRDPTSYNTSDTLQPSLLCLRARNVTKGSEDPNAGARPVVHGTVALFIALLASSFLVY